MSILVLQSSWLGRESWLLCLICLPGVSWWLSGSSSRCHGVVCSLWLWYFLIILTYYFWIDHQACSLLQYINVIANLFVMGNYFNELRWKIIRANNLLQFIHQVTIEIRFWKSLAQERFKSNLEFRNQIIVSFIKFWKYFPKFMIPIALFKKFLS